MKHLIGLLFCLIMFAVGTVTAHERNTTKEKIVQTSCLDIGKLEKVQSIFTIDYVKLRAASKIASIKAFNEVGGYKLLKSFYTDKYALLTRYKYVPDCPIVFVRSNYCRYQTQYSYSYLIPYNQPPNI